jgi:DNA-binding GntR family transcriptional regulator
VIGSVVSSTPKSASASQATLRQVLAFTVSYRSRYAYLSQQTRTANQQHRAILDALRERDAQRAEDLMRQHVSWSRELALQHFADLEPSDEPADRRAARTR